MKEDSSMDSCMRPIEILLVEDSPSDKKLTLAVLEKAKVANRVSHVEDGVEAMEYLRRQSKYANAPRPDLILLDLNLPRKDGREVLAELKNDPGFATIPVVILTTSKAEQDVLRSYQLHANCYITKPVDFTSFLEVIHSIEIFWLAIVSLPGRTQTGKDAL
jgi:two-component system, chemotaxis family, response regulator Rcp1